MTAEAPIERPATMQRGWVIGTAVAGILLGIIGLLVPPAALLGIALVFGISLIVIGTARLVLAFSITDLERRERWFLGLLGALVTVAGVLVLSNPWQSLIVLGIVIGLGWIADGVASIAVATQGFSARARWLPVIAGIVSIVAGVIVMIFPATGLTTFVLVAAILLILVGVATLFLLPKRS
ncbi:HdeD family acid-resistance protein [Arenivirga flava]|uniref:DUF308 domain-containing protein n=1 Tax=Arenivirga flava TaxID=1930060 RepID=A0AA37XBR8_9MICO|nr:DUF308 domain-containing protein [Arenivirga flava]GMA28710.1 hypothetical protein GCM10025874_19630 [Arenivirga flava]